MAYSKEHLQALLNLVKEISNKDKWFRKELHALNSTNPDISIRDDIWAIRTALNVRRNPTIDYSFVDYDLAREHLIIDNLRMENARYDTREGIPLIQFHNYCIYTFYQVENIINYYYWKAFPDFNNCLDYLSANGMKVTKNRDYRKLSDIDISAKLFRFTKDFFDVRDDFTAVNLSTLRRVRNESSHRCSVLSSRSDEDTAIFNFFKNQNFQTVHRLLEILVAKIRHLLSAPGHNPIVAKAAQTQTGNSALGQKNTAVLGSLKQKLDKK